MPRARISEAGPELAKPGYDVDTAILENMMFSPAYVAIRLALTGVVTPENYSSGDPAFLYNRYRRSIVTFDTPFPAPPIVLVAGLNIDGTTDQSPLVSFSVSSQSGYAAHLPLYEIQTYTDRFELYVIKAAGFRPSPADWRYFVFHNVLES